MSDASIHGFSMPEIATWEREHYLEGGGDPFLFYVVFGEVDTTVALSRSKYRCDGVPDGVDVMSYGPNQHPEVLDSFREGYLWDEFVRDESELSRTVAVCNHCTILRGTPTDASNLNYLRDSVGLITYFADNGGCVIYDPQMFRWWNPWEWKQHIFEPARPVPRKHTVILVSEEDNKTLKWFHTRGMRKFGRPDISVHDVSEDMAKGVIDLCNRLINYQAAGHVIPDGQEVRMASLPRGAVIRHAGDLDDPDFNNVHLEVEWRSGDG